MFNTVEHLRILVKMSTNTTPSCAERTEASFCEGGATVDAIRRAERLMVIWVTCYCFRSCMEGLAMR